MPTNERNLDDAATAALLAVSRLPKARTREHIGLVFEGGGGFRRTEPRASNSTKSRGTFAIPAGSARAIFHNHPESKGRTKRQIRQSGGGERFSRQDKRVAKSAGLPSYIITPEGRIRRFDPDTGEVTEVLAQFPIEEFEQALSQSILGRSVDDPRGLRREQKLGGEQTLRKAENNRKP